MSLYRPKTTLRLILYGFTFVGLPLILALVYSAVYVGRLSTQSQTAVYKAALAAQGSRQLLDQLTSMERNARQYLILKDPTLMDAYTSNHKQFQATASQLLSLPLDQKHGERVAGLRGAEEAVYELVQNAKPDDTPSQDEVAKRFANLRSMAQDVLSGSNRMIDREVTAMQEAAANARRTLFLFAAALVPMAIFFAGIFTVLISRPLRQLDRAIRRLGDGQFDSPVQVHGPQDLEFVARRLDWLRARLVELEEQKTRFLRHISHELKTPLAAIRESAQLLQDKVVGGLTPEQDEITQILQANTVQLQHRIEDLINFSTAHGEIPRLRLTDIRLRTLIDEVAKNHRPAILAKDLDLDLRIEVDAAVADEEKLRTVIDNLLSNAIKFSPRGARIAVEARGDARQIYISVTDEGPGIPPEERDAVFEPFFQGRRQPEGYVKGSGLGLSIAREYIRAHGGDIEVATGTGSGTTLALRIPRLGKKASR